MTAQASPEQNAAYRAGLCPSPAGRGETMTAQLDAMQPTCSVDGCDRPIRARGWCHRCYYRWKSHGDPTKTVLRPPGLDADNALRWTGWVETAAGCWEWKGERDRAGYGKVRFGKRKLMAHRLAYETWVAPVPAGLLVRHRKCDNPPCINPAHLEPGTQVDNMSDMRIRGRERKAVGEFNGSAKLAPADVSTIRDLAASGKTGTEIASLYGVSGSTARSIIRRDTWKHVA